MKESFPTTRPATYRDAQMNDFARALRNMSFGTVDSSLEDNRDRIENSLEREVASNPQTCPHCDKDRNVEVKDFSSFLKKVKNSASSSTWNVNIASIYSC